MARKHYYRKVVAEVWLAMDITEEYKFLQISHQLFDPFKDGKKAYWLLPATP